MATLGGKLKAWSEIPENPAEMPLLTLKEQEVLRIL
jgi:hypothetical protein